MTEDNIKDILLDLKREIHEKAIYPLGRDINSFVNLKVFDAVLNNIISKYTKRVCTDCTHFVGCECFSGLTCDQYETEVKNNENQSKT